MNITPRRLTGAVLRLSARGGDIPLLSSGLRAAGRSLLDVDRLRDARLQDAAPDLRPPLPTRRDVTEDDVA